jgi:hypothetical protein
MKDSSFPGISLTVENPTLLRKQRSLNHRGGIGDRRRHAAIFILQGALDRLANIKKT